MKRQLLALVLAVAMSGLATTASAIEGDTLWTRTFGGAGFDGAYSLIQTNDGGYLLTGWTNSFGAGDQDAYLVKVDVNGDTLWTRAYGNENYDVGYSVIQTNDGGYALAGYSYNFGPGFEDMFLVKTDAGGDTLWTRTYGIVSLCENAFSLIQTSDSGYLLAGEAYNIPFGIRDMYVVKTDVNGDTLWTRMYGGDGYEAANSVIETDGGYILAGRTDSFGPNISDIYLLKINVGGDTLWTRTYGNIGFSEAYSVIQCTDGGYLLVGITVQPGNLPDIYVVRTDSNGDSLWTRTYGGPNQEIAYSAVQTNDGGYLLAGQNPPFDMYLIKTDWNGDTLWTRAYGGNSQEIAFSVIQNDDSDYLLAGITQSFGAGSMDMYLVKVSGPTAPELTMTLTPYNPPIIIPESGGSFDYNIAVTNNGGSPDTFDICVNVAGPTGFQFPIVGPVYDLTLMAGASANRDRTLYVPGNAPGGTYVIWGAVGDFPWTIVATDSFTFTKEGAACEWIGSEGWNSTGETFPGEGIAGQTTARSFDLQSCSPNPFNSTTTIRFHLPVADRVRLQVYDTAGRLVTTLVNGWREAGTHEVTFDGSNLASGVYLYRLTAGSQTATGKMVLLK